MTKIAGFSQFSKHKLQYPNLLSALTHVRHDYSTPVPKTPEPYTLDSDSESEEVSPEDTGPSMNADPGFSVCDTLQPYLITQAEMFEIWNSRGHFPNGKEVQWKMESKYVV
jgi:hypothetical protein